RVAWSGFPKNDIQLPRAYSLVLSEIHIVQRRLQHFRGIIEIRRADTATWTRPAEGSSRDNGFSSMKVERDQSERDMQKRAAISLHFAGIDASQIDRRRGWSVDNKQPRW